jgi:lipopolysaccharide exporter
MKINFVFQILSLGLAFLINIYLIKNFTIGDYGIYSLLNTIIGFSSLAFALNIQEYLNRGLNKYKKYSIEQNIFFNSINSFMIVLNLIFLLLILIFYTRISNLFGIGGEYIMLIGFLIFFNIIFFNMQRYSVQNQDLLPYNVFLLTGNYSWFFIFYFVDFHLINIFIIKLITIVALLVIVFVYFKKNYKFKASIQFDKVEIKKAIKFGMGSFISVLGFFIIMHSDKVMISIMTDNASVGLYAFAILPFMMVFVLFQNIVLVVYTPKLTKLFHKNKSYRFVLYFKLLKLMLLILIPLYVLFIILSDYMILALGKDAYLKVSDIYPYLSIYFTMFAVSFILKQEFTLAKKFTFLNKLYFIAVILNIILNYVFILFFGYSGVVGSTIIVYIIINYTLWHNIKLRG